LSLVYLSLLVASIAGTGLIDWRFKLAAFVQPARTLLTLIICVIFFLIWDVTGIALGVFYTGSSTLITGVMLAPEMPLEEPFFLLLLCYSTLILFVSLSRRKAKA